MARRKKPLKYLELLIEYERASNQYQKEIAVVNSAIGGPRYQQAMRKSARLAATVHDLSCALQNYGIDGLDGKEQGR